MPKSFLICTQCGRDYPLERSNPRCTDCNEPLEVSYTNLSGAKIRSGRNILERYRDFLPFSETRSDLSLGEGHTPLVKSQAVGNALRLKALYFKNETLNPTWSFKDRGTLTGLVHAMLQRFTKIGTVSTGNMATSVAAYGAHAGICTYVLISKGIAREKVAPIAIYRPNLIIVDGDYSDLYYRSLEIGEAFDIYFINSDVPFRVEGSKTIAFEMCEQLNLQGPDYVVVPVSAAGNLRGILKGFEEFYHAGIVDRIPTMVAGQASGCAPIANAFNDGKDEISRIKEPDTIAHAIENPFPPSGNQMLRKLRENGGLAVKVTDQQILDAQHLMAREGLFVQPAAAVPLAVVQKLVADRRIKPKDTIVCVVTGGGLKYTAALDKFSFKSKEIEIANLKAYFKRIP